MKLFVRRILFVSIWLISFNTLGQSGFSSSAGGNRIEHSMKPSIGYRGKAVADEYMKERCKLDVYHPRTTTGFPTVVWFHGGGLTEGGKFIPKELQGKDVAVVAVNYRLAPRVKVEDCVDDAAAAVAWVFKNIDKYGGDPNLIFVAGHSAGGYLASMIGLNKDYLKKYGVDADKIAALIPYSGHSITHFTRRKEKGLEWKDILVDEMAPLAHIRKDAPPMVLVTGDRELELFGRYEEVAYFWRMMKLVGHTNTELYELDGYNHGDMAVPAHHILLNTIKKIKENKE